MRTAQLRPPTGFTLVECLVTMVTVMMVIAAVTTAYLYALRIVEFTKPKLGASDEARNAISLLTEEVRGARLVKIGTGSISTFTEVAPFTRQEGSALQLYPTTNYNLFIRYFWDSADKKLKRTTNGMTSTYVVANSVSNELVFSAQNYKNEVMTNNFNNRVIAMELKFYQIQFPITAIGPGNYYDFYQLRAKITRRTLL